MHIYVVHISLCVKQTPSSYFNQAILFYKQSIT